MTTKPQRDLCPDCLEKGHPVPLFKMERRATTATVIAFRMCPRCKRESGHQETPGVIES